MMKIQFKDKPMTQVQLTACEVQERYELALAEERTEGSASATWWRQFWEDAYRRVSRPAMPDTVTIRLDGVE